jgi:hypothetical protein
LLAKLTFKVNDLVVVAPGSVRRIVARPELGIWTSSVGNSVVFGPLKFETVPTGKREMMACGKNFGIERIPADGDRRFKVFLCDVEHAADDSREAWNELRSMYGPIERPAVDHRVYTSEQDELIARCAADLALSKKSEEYSMLRVAAIGDLARVKDEILRRIVILVELMPKPFIVKDSPTRLSRRARKQKKRREDAEAAFEDAIGDDSVDHTCESGKAKKLREWVRAHGSERGRCRSDARLFDVVRHARHVINHPNDDFVRRDDELLQHLTALLGRGRLDKTRVVLVRIREALTQVGEV